MEFKKRQQSITKAKLKNIAVLINNFENRMSSSLSSLKKLNQTKKQYDRESKKIDKKIERLEPKITKKILDLQKDLFVFFEWARKQSNNPQIKINKKVFAGTIMKGVFSSLKIENDIHNIKVIEKQDSNNNFYMAQQE
jgi:hypothetical protein